MRQSEPAAEQQPTEQQPTEQQAAEQQPDVVEVVWERLEPLLPPQKRTGRPYGYARRLVLEAIVHVMRTDCGWRYLPSQFPPWQTVYAQFTHWRNTGIWDTIWAGLDKPHPT